MSYTKYTNQEFQELTDNGQINIMALFGNGIDIQLMEYLESPYRTSYQNFYNYLCYKNFYKDNMIFQKMTKDKKENEKNSTIKQNWSDFENSLIEIFNENNYINEARLTDDFNHFQVEFSNFLNEIIYPGMLAHIGYISTEKGIAIKSFTNFLGDLDEEDYKKLYFPSIQKHYKLFNWEILNFNYTSLLDNVLMLDKGQFDPHPWPHADRQIQFYVNPHGYKNNYTFWRSDTNFSTYIMTNISHPHGYQNVPKSMLFGFDNENQITKSYNRAYAKYFLKPYWAQNDKRYKSYFNDTHLFIIYGMSIGISDYWWWNNILLSIYYTEAELIIYSYGTNESKYDVMDRFIDIALKWDGSGKDQYQRELLYSKIAVVQYDSETKLHAFKLDRLD